MSKVKSQNNYDHILRMHWEGALAGSPQVVHFNTDVTGVFCQVVEEFIQTLDTSYLFVKYRLTPGAVNEPYAPFLTFIKELAEAQQLSFEELTQKAGVYPCQQQLFVDYLSGRPLKRPDEPLFEELAYEQEQFRKSILKMLCKISEKHPLIIAVANLQFAKNGTIRLIEEIQNHKGDGRILFVFSLDKNHYFHTDEENHYWEDFVAKIEDTSHIFEIKAEHVLLVEEWPTVSSVSSYEELAQVGCDNLQFLALEEAKDYLGKILVKTEKGGADLSLALKYNILQALGDCHFFLEENDDALVYYEMVLELAQREGNAERLAEAYRKLAMTHTNKFDLTTAQRLSHQSIKFAEISGIDSVLAKALFSLYLLSQKRTVPMDKTLYFQLMDLLVKLGFNNSYAYCCQNVDIYQVYYDSVNDLFRLVDIAISIYKKNQNRFALAAAFHKKGVFYSYINDHQNALQYFKRSEKIRIELDNKLEIIRVNNGIGFYSMITEDYKGAFYYLNKAGSLLSKIRDYSEITVTLYNMARLYFFTRNYKEAVTIVDKIIKIMRIMRMGHIPFQSRANIYIFKALCHAKLGQRAKVLECNEKIFKRIYEINAESIHYYRMLQGQLHMFEGDYDAADAEFKQAERELDRNSQIHLRILPLYYYEYGMALKDMGREAEAQSVLEKGLEVCDQLGFKLHKSWIKQEMAGGSRDVCFPLPESTFQLENIVEIAKQDVALNKLQKKMREIRFLNTLQLTLVQLQEKKEIADKLLELININFPVDSAYLHVLDGGQWHCLASHGSMVFNGWDPTETVLELHKVGQEVVIDLSLHEKEYPKLKGKYRYVINIPMFSGKVAIGNLFLATFKEGVNLTRDDLDVLTIATNLVVVLFEKIDRDQALLRLSKTDVLTGLHNRQALQEKLGEELQRLKRLQQEGGGSLVVAFIDLDHFKYYNDTFGHSIGDTILKEFASLLQKNVREMDFVARYGGDEFIVVLPDTDENQAMNVAERIVKTMVQNEFFLPRVRGILNKEVQVPASKLLTCSVGLASYRFPDFKEENMDRLLLQADQALYQAKNSGKNQICVYQEQQG